MLTRTVGYFAWLLFAFALVLLVLTLRAPRLRPADTDDVRMPVLALEFVDSEAALHRIIGRPGDTDPVAVQLRSQLMKGLNADYVFIGFYWLLFVGLAAVLAQRGAGWPMWLAGAAFLAATGAAAFDVVENVRMMEVLREVRLGDRDVASAGFLKWLLSFVALALLSFTFFGRGGWTAPAAGVVCLVIAAVGIAGLAAIRSGVHETWPIEVAFRLMMFVLLPLVAWTLTVGRAAFLAGRG